MTQDHAAKAADPSTSHAELYELARTRPDLRPQIAGNPHTYPALLEWLGQLGDPAVDEALSLRSHPEAQAAAPPAQWQPTQTLPGHPPREQPTEEFGAIRRYPEEEPAAVQPPALPLDDFDQRVYGAATPYAANQPPYRPQVIHDPDEAVAPRQKKGGAGVLIFLLVLVTVAALAAAYFFLAGNPFDDGTGTDQQPAPSPTQEEDAAETEDPEEQGESPEPEESPSPTEEETEDQELESPVPDDALSMTEFSSPTGNINCQLSEEEVVCTVVEYDFEAPAECTDGVTFRVDSDGQAEIDCGFTVGGQGQALEYGEVTGNEGFGCSAQELYFGCWSQRTGNGFEVAREYYDLLDN